MASVGIPKVNGSAASPKQVLTASLSYFKLDAVDAANMASVGYTAGVANPGEKAIQALATVANPVIWDVDDSNTRIVYFAVEFPGVAAANLQTAVRTVLANATVASGVITVV